MRAVNLRTEYLINPVGIGAAHPRVFWNCEGGVKQTAWRIVSEKWDSGRVESDAMRARYPLPLVSGERVNYRIKLWDENGAEGEWSEPAFFEMGLLRADRWQAKWITGNYRAKKRTRYPVDCFRKTFSLPKSAARARLYITACGLYRAVLNGVCVSMPLAPGVTDYRKRVQYQTYDVTALLGEENELTVELADGWYRGSCGAWGSTCQYGVETKLLAQLEIEYADGGRECVVTDESWRWSSDGPLRFADNKDGEICDARRAPSYAGFAKVTDHPVTPTASDNVPVAEKETFHGKMSVTPSGRRLLDFGQNIAGYIAFRVEAKAGQTIRLRFGEMTRDGELYQKNMQFSSPLKTSPLQRIEYTCKEGVNEYKTRFAIFGFQYAEIDTEVPVRPEDFTAVAVYSDLEETGAFRSSNDLLDRFVEAARWSAKSNAADLPTDCPTRERQGWLGDAQLFVETAGYLFNCLPFFRKFEQDICDAQRKNGCFTQIAPTGGVDFWMRPMDGSAGWSDAGVFLPYRLYLRYGDETLLTEFYDRMKRYAEYKIGTMGKWYPTALPTGVGVKGFKKISNYGTSYGEWVEPSDVHGLTAADYVCPHPEETTAYLVWMLETMAAIAEILRKPGDKARYLAYAEKARQGYRALLKTKRFSPDTDRQAKLVRPLYLRLLDGPGTEYAKKRLIKALDRYGWRLGTGLLSTPLILYVLADIDIGYAYRLLENEEAPGWLSMPKAGANTVWESWEGPNNTATGVGSLNHYSKGAVVEWLFKEMCGIRVAGENRFVVAPRPGGHFTFAEASYRSVYGLIRSGWQKTETGWEYRISVPANCTAEILLPDGRKEEVSAGEYTF